MSRQLTSVDLCSSTLVSSKLEPSKAMFFRSVSLLLGVRSDVDRGSAVALYIAELALGKDLGYGDHRMGETRLSLVKVYQGSFGVLWKTEQVND